MVLEHDPVERGFRFDQVFDFFYSSFDVIVRVTRRDFDYVDGFTVSGFPGHQYVVVTDDNVFTSISGEGCVYHEFRFTRWGVFPERFPAA
jgi:hypothetical protein